MTLEITPAEKATTIAVLDKITKLKNVPQEIFDVFQYSFGGTSLEVVPIYLASDGTMKVFLSKRPDTDTYWPGELHIPGTMVFPWDGENGNGFDNAWRRLNKKEIMQQLEGKPIHVSTLSLNTRRGSETAVVHDVIISDPSPVDGGDWYSISELPNNIIDHHLLIIREGLLFFAASVKSGHYDRKDLDSNAIQNIINQTTLIK